MASMGRSDRGHWRTWDDSVQGAVGTLEGARVPVLGVAQTVRRTALFAVRFYECNPLKYAPDKCYNPVDTALTHLWNRRHHVAVARPYGVIHVDPRTIHWNLRVPPRVWPIGLILDGNWDTTWRRPVDIAWKIRSMHQRFRLGFEWIDTDLFQHFYRPRFEQSQAPVKGATTIAELVARYERVYDRLYTLMRDEGFKTPTPSEPDVSFVYVHIARNGELMYTLEGNHRLGIALALDLERIPVRVATRHRSWQMVRERFAAGSPLLHDDASHPDLHDLIGGS